MKEVNFNESQRQSQINWCKANISYSERGSHNGKTYEYIIPNDKWLDTVFPVIQNELNIYIEEKGIIKHTGVNNLMSSWVLSANLYFFVRSSKNFNSLMLKFLKQKVSDTITEILDVHFEFAFDDGNALHPSNLLG